MTNEAQFKVGDFVVHPLMRGIWRITNVEHDTRWGYTYKFTSRGDYAVVRGVTAHANENSLIAWQPKPEAWFMEQRGVDELLYALVGDELCPDCLKRGTMRWHANRLNGYLGCDACHWATELPVTEAQANADQYRDFPRFEEI